MEFLVKKFVLWNCYEWIWTSFSPAHTHSNFLLYQNCVIEAFTAQQQHDIFKVSNKLFKQVISTQWRHCEHFLHIISLVIRSTDLVNSIFFSKKYTQFIFSSGKYILYTYYISSTLTICISVLVVRKWLLRNEKKLLWMKMKTRTFSFISKKG